MLLLLLLLSLPLLLPPLLTMSLLLRYLGNQAAIAAASLVTPAG
jgi:hypothetical protein